MTVLQSSSRLLAHLRNRAVCLNIVGVKAFPVSILFVEKIAVIICFTDMVPNDETLLRLKIVKFFSWGNFVLLCKGNC